jgi:bacterioferritin (cytochrome b1)
MQGNPDVLKALVSMLGMEAHLNIQYRHDWRVVHEIGAKGTAHKIKKLGKRAHEFMVILADRVLDLDGETEYTVGAITEQSTLTEVFQNELKLEQGLATVGIANIQLAVANGDEATAEKLRHIEERHEDDAVWIERQLTLIGGMTEGVYIAVHLKK